MSPPTDVSGVRSSRDATIDAIVLALGLQIQAMLVERKAVERVLGCDADETVLDAATRVAGDLASAEKQIDDVRDVLKAKVGELTVDAATHAIVLAQNHATLVKQVEQLTRELDEARRRLKVEREHSEASDRHLVETHEALGGRTGVEHVTEAAKRVAQERDAYRIRVKDMESNVCKLSAERDEAKALATTLAKERDDARALCVAVSAELFALPDEPVLAAAKRVAQDLRDEVGEARQARRDRDQALAELNAVRRILPPMNDRETTVDAAKRVTERCDEARADAGRMMKELDDVRSVLEAKFNETAVDAARRAASVASASEGLHRAQDGLLAAADATIRTILGALAGETTNDAAKRVTEDLVDAEKQIDDVRTVLEAKPGETIADAARRVVAAAHAVVDAAREVERAAKVVSQTQEAISALEQKANEKEATAVLAALGARAGEKAIDVAKRVAKERDDLRDAFQTVSHCQQATARSFLSLAETLGVSPSDAASRVNSIIAREEEFRLAVAAYAQQDEELREILLAGPTERTLDAVRRMAKAYEDARKESFRLRNDLENIRKMTKAFDGETANAAVWRILGTDVAHQRDRARKELEKVRLLLSPKGSWESTADATARVIKERIEAIRDRDRALAALADTSSAVATRVREALGATSDERTEDAAKRVVLECRGAEARVSDNVSKMVELVLQRDQALAERDKLRDELDKRMSL